MAEGPVIVDTGPLVAYLDADDAYHDWSVDRFQELPSPLVTCEAVLAETGHLLRRVRGGLRIFEELLEAPWLALAFDLAGERRPVRRLLRKYEDLPISLADACLIRMAELRERAFVLTLDRQFRIYRMHGRKPVPAILPAHRV